MKILLTNDDGFKAVGIQALLCALQEEEGLEIFLVAPKHEQSAHSHLMHFSKPLEFQKVDQNQYWVEGSPADCVTCGLFGFLKHEKIDMVISGMNHGWNVGVDVHYSGTVAAASEATLFGIPAIAVSLEWEESQSYEEDFEKFYKKAKFFMKIFHAYKNVDFKKHVLNVNFPRGDIKGIKYGKTEFSSLFKRGISFIEDSSSLLMIAGDKNKEFEEDDVGYVVSGFANISWLSVLRNIDGEHPLISL